VPEKNKKYWEFKAKAKDEADLYLYIEIASWGGGGYAHSAQSFKRELDALGEIKVLNVYINSPGGDVFEGNAIYNMLKRKAKSCELNVYVDGLAASIASVIAMAGTKVIMPSNTMMMVHNGWMYTYGNSKELRDAADMLDKVNISIRQAYLNKAGDKLEDETIADLMDKESWLTAQECLDYGLCDEVIDEKQVAAKFDTSLLKNFKNVPNIFSGKENNQIDQASEEIKGEKLLKDNLEVEKAKLLLEIELI
jgi:ATP-dependent Clp protease protease subunit